MIMGVREWLGFLVGSLPLLGLLLWWWNELWYVLPLKATNKRLPPGHMGLPFVGDMLSFLWYFKFLKRPDDYITAKRRRYTTAADDGVGLFRSHLFGIPTIIACAPHVSKFVFHSDDNFILQWPTIALMGTDSVVAVQGKDHARLRSFVVNAINRPNSLRRIALLVQPRMVAALESWAHKAQIKAHHEIKTVTFENIGKLFGGFEAGPLLDSMDKLFQGAVKGMRAYPINIPGFAYHHAAECRKKLEEIFWGELRKRKMKNDDDDESERVDEYDLMDGLMKIEDEEGKRLSEKEVVDNIVNLIVAGYLSTALVTTWAIYYLAKYPNVLSKLREENMALKDVKAEDFISSEQVSKLEYTNKVVEETIRMANVAAFSFKRIIKEAKYQGYDFPKGWNVIIWLRYLHTNPENFEDPMCFNPDRWNKPAKPGTYQVFGLGSRICPGNMLARLQLAIFLHHLSIGYKWELMNPEVGMIYLPHPVPEDGVEVIFSKL